MRNILRFTILALALFTGLVSLSIPSASVQAAENARSHHGRHDNHGRWDRHGRHDRWDRHDRYDRRDRHHRHSSYGPRHRSSSFVFWSVPPVQSYHSSRTVVITQPAPVPAPLPAVPASDPYYAPNGTLCREYQSHVSINGVIQQSYGTACLKPDGSWRVAR